MQEHKPCYGKLFPSITCPRPGKEHPDAVFGYLIKQWGTVAYAPEIIVDVEAWDRWGVQLLPAAFGREDLAGDSGEELNRYKDCDKIMQLRKNTENRLHSRYGSKISTVYD